MTKESKQKLLQVYDLLGDIARGRTHIANTVHHGKSSGGWIACDCCNGPLYEANQHSPECPIGNAVDKLQSLIPPWDQRDAWLNDDSKPVLPNFTPPKQPDF